MFDLIKRLLGGQQDTLAQYRAKALQQAKAREAQRNHKPETRRSNAQDRSADLQWHQGK